MTLKSSSCNTVDIKSQIFGRISRSAWQTALYSLVFFFALPFASILVTQRYTYNTKGLRFAEFINEALSLVHSNLLLTTVIVVMGVVSGISAFSYLHSKKQNDFYHSAPLSRTRLFFINYFSGTVHFFAAYFINFLLSLVLSFFLGVGSFLDLSTIFSWLFIYISLFISIYTITVFSAQLTGSIVTHVLMSGTILCIFPIFIAIYYSYIGRYLLTYAPVNNLLSRLIAYTTPVGMFLTSDLSQIWLSCLWLIISAILCVLSVLIYKKRRSESASRAVIFAAARTVLKYSVCTISAALFGIILDSISYGRTGWTIFGLLAGGLISHCVMEIIYHYDFKAIFLNLRGFAVFAIIFSACVLPVVTGSLPYDTYLPDKSDIESVNIDIPYALGGAMPNNVKPQFVSDEAFISAVHSLSHNAILNLHNDISPNFGATVTFKLKNGKLVHRYYSNIDYDQTIELQKTIVTSDDFQMKSSFLFNIGVDAIVNLGISQLPNDNQYQDSPLQNKKMIAEIIGTLKQDLLELTPENISSQKPVAIVYFNAALGFHYEPTPFATMQESVQSYMSTSYPVGILSGYTRTLNLLTKYGLYKTPAIDVSQIESITSSYLPAPHTPTCKPVESEPQQVVLAEDYDYILSNFVPSRVFLKCNPFMDIENTLITIELNDHNDTTFYGYIQKQPSNVVEYVLPH